MATNPIFNNHKPIGINMGKNGSNPATSCKSRENWEAMYRLSKNDGYLLVELKDNFDFPVIQTIIHHETSLQEYPDTNDIWLIGAHHADIHLGEIEQMVREFQCRCPRNATRTRTAVVVNEGLTGAIIELWLNGLKHRVPFEIRIFQTLVEAQAWLGIDAVKVA